jgi:hypothetical protein
VTEPVPEAVKQAARRAFADRDADADVLELVHDSLLEDHAPAAYRQLAFGAGDGNNVDVTVEQLADGVLLRVDPARFGADVVEVRVGELTAEAAEGSEQELRFPKHGILCVTLAARGRRWKTSSVRV